MSPRRTDGPSLTVIWWHEIPSAVLARDGSASVKTELPARFQHAIDRAAMGGGQAGSGAYMDGWTRRVRPCSGDLAAEVDAEVGALEERFPPAALDTAVKTVRTALRSAVAGQAGSS